MRKMLAFLGCILAMGITLSAWHEVEIPAASKSAVDYVAPRSASDTKLMFRYGLCEAPAGSFNCELWKGSTKVKTVSVSERAKYVEFDGLEPDTEYTFKVVTDCSTLTATARTLKQITGEKLFSFAVVSDPHVSFNDTTVGTRLFGYSREILEDCVKIANDAKCSAMVIPGDIVNSAGQEPEFAAATAILKKFKGTLMPATGNHDVGAASRADYKKLFGDGTGLRTINGTQFAWINTGNGFAVSSANQKIFQRLNAKQPTIFFSHYQLTPDDFIVDDDKCIHDKDKAQKYLDKLANVEQALIYIGHKNSPTETTFAGKHPQMNCPQPTQFPCGMLIVDVYTSGYHQYFVPTASASMDEVSRLSGAATEAKVYSRDAKTFAVCNQFISKKRRKHTLYLIRHGQVNNPSYNAPTGETRLTPLAEDQAKMVGAYVKQINFKGTVYVSPHWRAMQTATAVCDAIDTKFILDEGLQEHSIGSGGETTRKKYGCTKDQFTKYFPRSLVPADFPDPWCLKNETEASCYARTIATMDRLLDKTDTQNVMFVCHGGVMTRIKAELASRSGLKISGTNYNCSLFVLELDENNNLISNENCSRTRKYLCNFYLTDNYVSANSQHPNSDFPYAGDDYPYAKMGTDDPYK